jgi:protein TonB
VAAAAIVIATIGIPLSKLWLSRQEIVVVQQPAPAATPAHVEKTAVVKPVVAVAPKVETPVAPPPRPSPTPAPRVAKPTRPTAGPAQPAVEPPVLAVNAPSATSLPVAEPVAVAAPPPPPPAAAMGPFFEARDVDRAPQVTSRIEPNLPDGVDQTRQEILIVRVLVSQAGQPTLVSLLRRSKSGAALDAAVVDTVKRWSFSPAIRRGEAVSCFLNVGVPVGGR